MNDTISVGFSAIYSYSSQSFIGWHAPSPYQSVPTYEFECCFGRAWKVSCAVASVRGAARHPFFVQCERMPSAAARIHRVSRRAMAVNTFRVLIRAAGAYVCVQMDGIRSRTLGTCRVIAFVKHSKLIVATTPTTRVISSANNLIGSYYYRTNCVIATTKLIIFPFPFKIPITSIHH